MKCAILKALHRFDEAEQLGVSLSALDTTLKHETYVAPFAMFELGSMFMNPEILNKAPPPDATAATVNAANADAKSAALSPVTSAAAGTTNRTISALDSMNLYMTEANEAKMYTNFGLAESNFKRAKKYSSDFNFKMRLHFRVHLALDELNWMKVCHLIYISHSCFVTVSSVSCALSTDRPTVCICVVCMYRLCTYARV
jgi:hypothetical protein